MAPWCHMSLSFQLQHNNHDNRSQISNDYLKRALSLFTDQSESEIIGQTVTLGYPDACSTYPSPNYTTKKYTLTANSENLDPEPHCSWLKYAVGNEPPRFLVGQIRDGGFLNQESGRSKREKQARELLVRSI